MDGKNALVNGWKEYIDEWMERIALNELIENISRIHGNTVIDKRKERISVIELMEFMEC